MSALSPLTLPPLLPASFNFQLPATLSFAHACILLAFFLLSSLLFPPRGRPLSITEQNTRKNRYENGGTGARGRTWRKALLPPLKFGDEAELEGAGIEEGIAEAWKLVSKPAPSGLKGCLKRAESFEAASRQAVLGGQLPALSSCASSLAHSPSPPPATIADTGSSLPSSMRKSVRVVEPSLHELQALRALWSSPEMQGETGAGGIGGYRRTRDFYSRSQGGKAIIKGAGGPGKKEQEKRGEEKKDSENTATEPKKDPLPQSPSTLEGSSIPATQDDGANGTLDKEGNATPSCHADSAARRSRHSSRLAPPTAPTRVASLSPSPVIRRAHQRTLSPSSLSAAVCNKASPSRRRALSPVVAPASRSSSAPPTADRRASAVPRWVRTKGGRVASPAPPAAINRSSSRDSTSDEEEEEVEAFDEDDAEPLSPVSSAASPPASPVGVAKLAAAFPSPASSILSGAESEQESPSPSLILLPHPRSTASNASEQGISGVPSLLISPSTPPISNGDVEIFSALTLPPAITSLTTESSPLPPSPAPSPSPSSTPLRPSDSLPSPPSNTAAEPSTSPSPCVQKERRLSLRVQQAVAKKERSTGGWC
ncbi:hypothetical protein JCM11641_001042 [Rhodosporidiobolus odoratus]